MYQNYQNPFKVISFILIFLSTGEFQITYLLTYLLTYLPTYSVELTGSQLFKNFPAFDGTRRLISAFTITRRLSLS